MACASPLKKAISPAYFKLQALFPRRNSTLSSNRPNKAFCRTSSVVKLRINGNVVKPHCTQLEMTALIQPHIGRCNCSATPSLNNQYHGADLSPKSKTTEIFVNTIIVGGLTIVRGWKVDPRIYDRLEAQTVPCQFVYQVCCTTCEKWRTPASLSLSGSGYRPCS